VRGEVIRRGDYWVEIRSGMARGGGREVERKRWDWKRK